MKTVRTIINLGTISISLMNFKNNYLRKDKVLEVSMFFNSSLLGEFKEKLFSLLLMARRQLAVEPNGL